LRLFTKLLHSCRQITNRADANRADANRADANDAAVRIYASLDTKKCYKLKLPICGKIVIKVTLFLLESG